MYRRQYLLSILYFKKQQLWSHVFFSCVLIVSVISLSNNKKKKQWYKFVIFRLNASELIFKYFFFYENFWTKVVKR